MILSILSGTTVLLVTVITIRATWRRAPWSAPEPVRLSRRRRRAESNDRYELAVRRGRLVTGSFDTRLRPMLREIATTRLRRAGIDAHLDPDAATVALGPELATAIGLGAVDPAETRRRAMTLAELDHHLQRLEAL